jgi:hypothetical protein
MLFLLHCDSHGAFLALFLILSCIAAAASLASLQVHDARLTESSARAARRDDHDANPQKAPVASAHEGAATAAGSVAARKVKASSVKKPFTCEMCEYTTSERLHLKMHQKVRTHFVLYLLLRVRENDNLRASMFFDVLRWSFICTTPMLTFY